MKLVSERGGTAIVRRGWGLARRQTRGGSGRPMSKTYRRLFRRWRCNELRWRLAKRIAARWNRETF